MSWLVRRPTVVLAVIGVITLILSVGTTRLSTRLDLLALYAASTDHAMTAPTVMLALPDGTDSPAVTAAQAAVDAVPGVVNVDVLAVPDTLSGFVAAQMATAMWGRPEARPAVIRATLGDDPHALTALEAVAVQHDGALLGLPVLDEAHGELVTTAVPRLLGLVAVVFFALLVGLWRRPAAALVPIGSVAVGVLWLLGLVGWFAVPIGGPMLALVPLVAVLGLTDAIHVAWRLAPLGSDRPPGADAVAATLAEVGRACAWTSVTTGTGLLALLVVDSTVLQRFGVWGAVGMALVYVTGVGLPAALIVRFPFLAPRPRRLCIPAAASVGRAPAFALVLALFAGLGGLAATVQVDLLPGNDLPRTHPVLARHLEQDAVLGGLHPVRVLVTPRTATDDPRAFEALVALQRAAVNHPAVGSVVSFADAMLVAARSTQRTIQQIVGRPGRRGSPARYRRTREHALDAAARLTDLELDDGRRWTMHLRLHHLGASAWASVFDTLRDVAGNRVGIELDGYPRLVVATRENLVRDAWSVFGLAGAVALACLALLTRRAAALVALPLVAVTGLAVLAGLALTGVPLSHANLFALSVAVGAALDPWIHLVAGRRPPEPPEELSEASEDNVAPPVVVGQGLVAVGLLLLATSEVTTLAQVGPVLAGAILLNGGVTGVLWRTTGTGPRWGR